MIHPVFREKKKTIKTGRHRHRHRQHHRRQVFFSDDTSATQSPATESARSGADVGTVGVSAGARWHQRGPEELTHSLHALARARERARPAVSRTARCAPDRIFSFFFSDMKSLVQLTTTIPTFSRLPLGRTSAEVFVFRYHITRVDDLIRLDVNGIAVSSLGERKKEKKNLNIEQKRIVVCW